MQNSQILSPSRERLLLLTLAGIQFSHILDFMIVMPLGPQLTKIFAITDAQFGLLVSAYTFAAGASGLLASLYVDRFGRKALLLTLYVLFALSTLACALASIYTSLMVARIAAGMFGGVLSALSQTIVADLIPFERRGRAMGIVMSSFAVSTVAGVPLSLLLATYFNWHAPFFAIAGICAVLAVLALKTLPPLREHLQLQKGNPLQNILQLLREPHLQRAFMFSAVVVSTGFLVIPFITIYVTSNGGLTANQINAMYLLGGAATLVSTPFIGRWSDQRGKLPVFRMMAVATCFPLMLATVTAPLGWQFILCVSTAFFICMSGRMTPAMALLSAAAHPSQRGAFMAINASVQSLAMGVAAFVGGQIVSRDAQGQLQNYWVNGMIGLMLIALSIWLSGIVARDVSAQQATLQKN